MFIYKKNKYDMLTQHLEKHNIFKSVAIAKKF